MEVLMVAADAIRASFEWFSDLRRWWEFQLSLTGIEPDRNSWADCVFYFSDYRKNQWA